MNIKIFSTIELLPVLRICSQKTPLRSKSTDLKIISRFKICFLLSTFIVYYPDMILSSFVLTGYLHLRPSFVSLFKMTKGPPLSPWTDLVKSRMKGFSRDESLYFLQNLAGVNQIIFVQRADFCRTNVNWKSII